MCFVRLACVRHAASVHPEPGSNSRYKVFVSSPESLCNSVPSYCFLGLLNLSIQPFLKNLLKNFQSCCLLFSYQCSLCFACLLRVSFCIIPCVSFNVKYIFQLFLHFFDLIFTYTIYVNTSFTFHIIQLYKRTEKEGFEPSRRY